MPWASTTRAPAGTLMEPALPTLTIRLPWMTTVWFVRGMGEVPSITLTLVIATVVCPEAGLLDPASASEVEKTTNGGAFRIEGGLFGKSGTRIVGTLCPSNETRTAFRVDEIDEPLFGGRCVGNGFLNSNEADCRIVVQFTANVLSAVTCVWEVTSR